MGKHSRLKGSTKDKKRQPHADPPAPKLRDAMGDAQSQLPPQEASPEAAGSQKTAAARGIPEAKSTSLSPSEEVRHLRTLNSMLAKQMVEVRQERDQDQSLLSHLERGVARTALAVQLSQEAACLVHLAGERGRAEGADAATREVTREMDELLAEKEAKWAEAVAEIEKKGAAASEGNVRLTRDLKALAQEKVEVEERLQISERELGSISGSLADVKKALERAQEDNERLVKDMQELLFERNHAWKHFDEQAKQRKGLEVKLSDLELRREEAIEAMDLARSEHTQLATALEEMKAAVDLLKLKKASVERRLAASLQLVEDLQRQMAETAAAKEELEQTKVERERAISMKEVECANLEKTNSDLNSELVRSREKYESLRAEEEFLRSQVEELKENNGAAGREVDDLRVEFKRRLEEEEVNIRGYQLRVEGCLRQIDDLTRKAEENARSKEEMEKVKAKREDEIFQLQEMIADLNSEVATLQDVSSNRARENEQLRAEKDDAVKRLDEQTVKTDALMMELMDLEKGKHDLQEELRGLQTVNVELMVEKQLKKDHIRDAERRLDDAEQKIEAAQNVAEQVLSMLKGVAAEMAQNLGARGAPRAVAVEEVDEEIRPFAAEIEAISRSLRSREAEMEHVNWELKRQRESMAAVQAESARWKWFSSAIGLAAALVSVALAARGR